MYGRSTGQKAKIQGRNYPTQLNFVSGARMTAHARFLRFLPKIGHRAETWKRSVSGKRFLFFHLYIHSRKVSTNLVSLVSSVPKNQKKHPRSLVPKGELSFVSILDL
jgi:hypothetical protein